MENESRYAIRFTLVVAIITIGGLITATIYLRYTDLLGEEFASLIIGGIGAFATATLAIATYNTVLQNRRTVEELQKDREKPLAKDKLRQLVVPLIDKLDSKIEDMEQETTAWVQVRDSFGSPVGSTPYGRLLSDDISDTVLRELERDNPKLLEQIKNHDDTASDMEETVDNILEALEERIQEFVDEHSLEDDEGEPVDTVEVSKYVQAEYSGDSPPRNHEEFWESHGDVLKELKDEKIVDLLDKAESNYSDCCKSLRSELIDYKVELQQRYGISEQDIGELNIDTPFR